MARNNPTASQQPAPSFANDPSGYWAGVLAGNAAMGISALLPVGSLVQSDVAVRGRILAAQIAWQSYELRWNGAALIGSLSDAQFFLEVEPGGDTPQGRLTVLVNKLQLGGKYPKFQDTIQIKAGNRWHAFTVAEIIGEHDDKEPGLVLYLEKDQNGNGD